MFDRVNGLIVKCPKCGKWREREFQTKAFLNVLHDYKIGELVQTDAKTFDCIGECPVCKTMNTFRVKIENGILTNECKMIK